MRTRAIIFISILAVVTAVSFSGCKKFLDKDLQGTLTQQAFPVSPSDALLATNATYEAIREWYYNAGGFPIFDIMSDDARKGSNPGDAASTVGPYDNFTYTPTQDGLDRYWNALYVGVKRANVVIEKIPEIIMDENLKTRYIAEAKFIRGMIYFDFVRSWGGVPLVTTTDPPLKLPRASAGEVYSQIIEDLNFAIENLPMKSEYQGVDLGRATQGAAQALLARVYLFRSDFVNAEKYAMDVINSNQYGLEPLFVDANGVNGNNGIESVFEVGAIQSESTGSGGNQYANTQGVRGTPNRGWGFNRPTIDLRNSFASGDPRYPGTVINLGDTIDGIVILGDGSTPDITYDEQGNIIEIECYTRKVWVPGDNVITQWGCHRRLIRYADVLLMAAETLNENNKPAEALIYLNQVRQRARQGNNNILPDITNTNQSELRDIIFDERRHELAMEGWRFWDLVRTGRAAQVLGPLGFIAGKHELLPIPQSEIDISQGSLLQNPNW
ncbi:MAG: RagB/SusD family nutrient uptake outer membrane protein [Bacteroidetes bacterium]|nr:MAG: RagB/SusD family nutrient uptake outer membrane protein [Bacteroidota bacterium]